MQEIKDDIHNIKVTLAEIKADMKQYNYRTEQLEDKQEQTDKKLSKVIYGLVLAIGATASQYGANVLKLLGVIL